MYVIVLVVLKQLAGGVVSLACGAYGLEWSTQADSLSLTAGLHVENEMFGCVVGVNSRLPTLLLDERDPRRRPGKRLSPPRKYLNYSKLTRQGRFDRATN